MFKDSFKNTILFSILFFLFFYSFSKGVSSEEKRDFYTYDEIEKMCLHNVRSVPKNIINRNPKYRNKIVTSIEKAQNLYSIYANWIVAIIFKESSFRKSLTDSKGAFGLMQVSPYMQKVVGCRDKKTIDGQIDCGTKTFHFYINNCNSYKGGFSGYASKKGICKPIRGTRLNWVVNQREKLAIELDSILQ